jgi:hypothetical protein
MPYESKLALPLKRHFRDALIALISTDVGHVQTISTDVGHVQTISTDVEQAFLQLVLSLACQPLGHNHQTNFLEA